MFAKMIDGIYSSFSSISFDVLVWIVLGTFAAITLILVILCFAVPKIRAVGKRPYLGLVNAYTAVVLAAFMTEQPIEKSVLAAALFWCLGYLLYGFLCLITKPVKREENTPSVVTFLPTRQSGGITARAEVPAAKSSVRLEHAISVTDRLLQKNLGKSDRQELEKLKSTLAVLQMKGELTPAESDILNDNFNALLKLMAKYNI